MTYLQKYHTIYSSGKDNCRNGPFGFGAEEDEQANAENDPGMDADDGLTQDAQCGCGDQADHASGNAIEKGVGRFIINQFFDVFVSDHGESEGRGEDGGGCVLRAGGVPALGGGEADYGAVAVGGAGAGAAKGLASRFPGYSSAGILRTLSRRPSDSVQSTLATMSQLTYHAPVRQADRLAPRRGQDAPLFGPRPVRSRRDAPGTPAGKGPDPAAFPTDAGPRSALS